MNKQELLEITYSRRGLMQSLKEDLPLNDIVDLLYAIEEYRNQTYSYASKNQRIQDIRVESIDIAYQVAANVLRCNGEITPIQGICSSLAPLLSEDLLNGIRTAAEILAIGEGKLYELMAHDYSENHTGTLALEPYIRPTEDVLSRIEEFMYVPPMVIEPKRWKRNKGGGHYTQEESCILGKDNHHDMNQALDCLNILQKIQWEMDPKILALNEEPNKVLDTADKLQQFKIMKITSQRVYQQYQLIPFYFMWKFDKRGRMYSSGYHINFQSTDYKKALLSFNTKETITGV